jgi:hypothetical protein
MNVNDLIIKLQKYDPNKHIVHYSQVDSQNCDSRYSEKINIEEGADFPKLHGKYANSLMLCPEDL